MMEDDLRDGLVPAYTELLKDEKFQELLGALATMWGVVNRKVTSIDQRSFKAAKERLTAFVARTSGWNAKVSRDTRNGSWRRGAVHPAGEVEGRPDSGDVERVGRRGSGVRGAEGPAPDSPSGVKAPQRPSLRDACPSCQAKHPGKVWRVKGQLVCPACIRTVRKVER